MQYIYNNNCTTWTFYFWSLDVAKNFNHACQFQYTKKEEKKRRNKNIRMLHVVDIRLASQWLEPQKFWLVDWLWLYVQVAIWYLDEISNFFCFWLENWCIKRRKDVIFCGFRSNWFTWCWLPICIMRMIAMIFRKREDS